MRSKFTVLNTFAWLVIAAWLTRSLVFRLIHVDFASMEIARNFRQVWVVVIPLAIGVLALNSWKDKILSKKKVISLVLKISISAGLIITLNFFSSFCEWAFSDPLFQHKTENIEIRNRFLNCGAYDSDPTRQLVSTRFIGIYLIQYSEIDTAGIDRNEWIKSSK